MGRHPGGFGGRSATKPQGRLAETPGVLILLGVAVAYGGLAQIQLLLVGPEYGMGSSWLPAGLALAALLRLPTLRWAWALGGVALATVVGDLLQGYPAAQLPWWVVGNLLNPLAGAWLIRRVGGVSGVLERARDVAYLAVFGVVAGPLIGATVGSIGFAAAIDVPWPQLWPKYVLGDALGILVLAPALLARPGPSWPSWPSRPLERTALLAALLTLPPALFTTSAELWTVPLPYTVLPLLGWAAVRFGLRGGSLALLWVSLVANAAMALGRGPFVAYGAPEGVTVLLVQLYMGTTAISTLALAALASELSDRRAVERGLRDQARRDALTGLPNRTFFAEALPRALMRSRAEGSRFALLVCDLDDFKVINDTLGHQAGDETLVAVAGRLSDAVRDGDIVARLGGDEFVLVVQGPSDAATLEAMIARLVERVGEPIRLTSGHVVRTGVSVGVALAHADDDADALLAHADMAMYRAKQAGGGQVRQCHHEHRRRDGLEQRALQDDLVPALARGEIDVALEPLHDRDRAEVVAWTARMRWQHPERGLLEAGAFVAVAEAMGVSGTLFRTALERALTVSAGVAVPAPPVAVPVPPRLVTDPELVDVVAAELAARGVPPARLCLDVPATAAAQDPSEPQLSALASLGVRLAAVGVGQDWSSMPRLSGVAWDLLKVDAALVARLPGADPEPRRLLAALVALADAWDTRLAAEGVTSHEQLVDLEALGCRISQGPLLGEASKPA